MKTLIFATHNAHKVEEIHSLIPSAADLKIVSLDEAGFHQDIPEPHPTLEENAREKSKTIYRLTGKDCFSEDTGLEVDFLGGEPGVLSARYAGPGKSAAANVQKLLARMGDAGDRRARFRTVISLWWEGREHQFEGVCEGQITGIARGAGGFGYDPVFIPLGADRSFAEMELAEKNQYSHRAKAVAALVDFLSAQVNL